MLSSTLKLMKDDLFCGMPVTLQELLKSREERAHMQAKLTQRYACPVVCLLCNMPGDVKLCAFSCEVFRAGQAALDIAFENLPLKHTFVRECATGPEGYFLVDAAPEALKRICCATEEEHPLGRLMDIDVLPPGGAPLSRTALGFAPRTCVVCGAVAADCVSRARHALEDVRAAMLAIFRKGGA